MNVFSELKLIVKVGETESKRWRKVNCQEKRKRNQRGRKRERERQRGGGGGE